MARSSFSPFTLALAGRMHTARIQAGESQDGVARKLGITAKTVANWERGEVRVSAEDLVLFAKACGTTPAALLEGL